MQRKKHLIDKLAEDVRSNTIEINIPKWMIWEMKNQKFFWKMFKKKAPDKSCNATSKDQFKHFQNLAAQNEYVGENNSNVHDRSYNEGENNEDRRSTFEELDVKITIDEIVKSCNKLRSDKVPSLDNILYKYF